MKTKIITLESHDDLISVRDKLSWAKTPRILLVWPKYEKVTLRLLDLKVLQRHADSLGAQLGLVTRRANVRRDAESLGIPVFDSTASAQRDLWLAPAPRKRRLPPPPRRDLREMRDEVYEKEPAWRTSLFGRLVTFTAGVMAVLVVAGLFVPRAAVTLYPESHLQSVVVPVSASVLQTSVSITGSIPAQELSVTVEAEQSMPVSSRIAIPKSKAKGIARFSNLTSNEIVIPAGTVVSASPSARFVTLNDALLPAGTDEFVEIPIEALTGGSVGNVEPDSILFVEGPLGLSVTVANPEPTTGGTDTRTIGADEEDRAQLRETVMEELKRSAETKFRAQIGADDLLLLDALEIKEILLEEFTPPENEAGNLLELKMQAEISALYVLRTDLEQLAAVTLGASPRGFVPFGEAEFDLVTSPVTDSSGVTRFNLEITRTSLRDVNAFRAYSLIRGRDIEQAYAILKDALVLREEPQIAITPSWWKYLPLIPFNISVEIK